MGRGKIEMKKKEGASSRNAFCKKSEGVFKKARELSILCDAEVAVILLSSDGRIAEFASSDMKRILARFNKCLKSTNQPTTLAFNNPEEEHREVSASTPESQDPDLSKWQLLGKDIKRMGLHELLLLERKLTEGMLHIKDRKMEIQKGEVEHYRMKEQHARQFNQALLRMVEEQQSNSPTTGYPLPLSVHFPKTGGDFGPTDGMFLPSTSYAAPDAIDNVRADDESDTTLALGPTWNGWRNEDVTK